MPALIPIHGTSALNGSKKLNKRQLILIVLSISYCTRKESGVICNIVTQRNMRHWLKEITERMAVEIINFPLKLKRLN